VRDDGGPLGTRQIKSHTTGRNVGRVDTNIQTGTRRLTGGRIGSLAGRHGHDLHAHDHEAVIEDPHHHDQEDRKDEGELDERLTFTPTTDGANSTEVG
jgi:hypothetical protein